MPYKRHNNYLTLHGKSLSEINEKMTNKTFQSVHTDLFEIKGDNVVHSMSLDLPESTNVTFTNTAGLGVVTINDVGWYDVSYKVGHKFKKGGKKSNNQVKVSIIKNNTNEIESSVTWTAKTKKNKNGTNVWRGLLYFEEGDNIKLSIQNTGGGKIKIQTQKSIFSLTKT